MTSNDYEADVILSPDGFGHSCDFCDGGGNCLFINIIHSFVERCLRGLYLESNLSFDVKE